MLGERNDRTDGTVIPGAPIVRVDGLALLGEIVVRHPKPKERLQLPDGRGAFADRVPLRAPDAAATSRDRRTAPGSAVRRWVAGALAAVALALPFGWVLSADDVAGAVFGSTSCEPACPGAAADAPTVQVRTFGAFGSVEVSQLPAAGTN